MTNYFIIKYTHNKDYINATIDQQCDDISLGEGLKDICLYLKNNHSQIFTEIQLSENREFTISWEQDITSSNYLLMPGHDIIHRLKELKNVIENSQNFEQKYKKFDFITDNMKINIDDIIVCLSDKGKKEAISKYSEELAFLMTKVVPKLIPLNQIKIEVSGMSFIMVKNILSEIYEQIPGERKNKFHYQIDFDELVFR